MKHLIYEKLGNEYDSKIECYFFMDILEPYDNNKSHLPAALRGPALPLEPV